MAKCHVAGWYLSPVHDSEGNQVGTRIFYLQSGDSGGSIPSFVQNSFAPKTAKQCVMNLCEYLRKLRREKESAKFVESLTSEQVAQVFE